MSFPGLNDLANAIATLEGYGADISNVPTSLNNPGDLKNGNIGYGSYNGITAYNTPEAGWTALYNQLTKIGNGQSANYSPDTTLTDFGQKYANDSSYGARLANMLGVAPNTTIGSILNGNPSVPSSSSDSTSSTDPNSLMQQIWKVLWGDGFFGGAASQEASQQAFGNIGSKVTNPVWGAIKDFLTSSQLIMLIVGLLLIAAGLFSFKTTQNVINTTRKGIQAITP